MNGLIHGHDGYGSASTAEHFNCFAQNYYT